MVVFADFRLKKEMESFSLLPNSNIKKIKPENKKFYATYEFYIFINKGIYSPKKYIFWINLYEDYPFRPPKILCKTKIYHPNIDEEGHVCMNIIREDWTCSVDLQQIIFGIYLLFSEFSAENALNIKAGELLSKEYEEFLEMVEKHRLMKD